MRYRIIGSICLGIIIAVLIGLVLHTDYPKEINVHTLQNQQLTLVQSYQQVLSIVVTVRGDNVNDWDPNKIVGLGTGFFINEEYIITAAHVARVIDGNTAEIKLWDERIIPAQLIARDDANDLALLRIDSNSMDPNDFFKLTHEVNPQIGEKIFMIGSPRLFYNTLSSGVFSRGTTIELNRWLWSCDFYLVDINGGPGSSGSPVFNTDLELVGVIVGYTPGFAIVIPSYSIIRFLNENGVQ